MIITRSPLRISLGGGGTDLPSYYREYSGFLIAAAMSKYVYITLHRTFEQEIIVKYSKMERIKSIEEIQHPIIREALKMVKAERGLHLEITSLADIPAGSGLGSSGSFTTALLKALYALKRESSTTQQIAEKACQLEIDILKEPIGKQDQYVAAFGGISSYTFFPDGHVEVKPLNISSDTIHELEDNLLLFFTGYTRNASEILREQDDKSHEKNKEMIENLHFIKDIGYRSQEALETGNLREFASLMHNHWIHKQKRSKKMSNTKINNWYDLALKNGALGGKLIGAGGGGFLMFYAEDKKNLRSAMKKEGLAEIRFTFDFEGTKILVNDGT